MTKETMEQIRTRLLQSDSLSAEQRHELLHLVDDLGNEVARLSKTRSEDAESITGFVNLSTREATREARNPQLLETAMQGLSLSIREFETSHPKLVQTVNGISSMLSNLGI